jgi:hypothetical protein
MIEPVAIQHLLAAAAAGAMIIVFGALYALLFAQSRLRDRPGLMQGAYAAYLALVACVAVLVRTLNLTGFWQGVAAVMVVGYFVAPRLIWNLCAGTHGPDAHRGPDEETQPRPFEGGIST